MKFARVAPVFLRESFWATWSQFQGDLPDDFGIASRSIVAHFCSLAARKGRPKGISARQIELTRVRIQDAIPRALCIRRFFANAERWSTFLPRGIPRRGIKSCLDRDITERSSFGGFTVAIIPINRAPFQPPLGLQLRAEVPPADQFPRRGFWAALHSSKTLSASHAFSESVTTVSQIPISEPTSHQRRRSGVKRQAGFYPRSAAALLNSADSKNGTPHCQYYVHDWNVSERHSFRKRFAWIRNERWSLAFKIFID